MKKTQGNKSTTRAFAKPKETNSKNRWNVFGLRRENERDEAALTFARLGLLASRW